VKVVVAAKKLSETSAYFTEELWKEKPGATFFSAPENWRVVSESLRARQKA
jgi:hypothetical protein